MKMTLMRRKPPKTLVQLPRLRKLMLAMSQVLNKAKKSILMMKKLKTDGVGILELWALKRLLSRPKVVF
jgi:hypothetical protein